MEHVKKLIEYLSKFGQVKYKPGHFSGDIVDFHTIELMAKEKLAEGLEREINSHLTLECGHRACVRLLQIKEHENSKLDYVMEIVPYSYVPKHQWQDASDEVLKDLPRIIKTYLMKN